MNQYVNIGSYGFSLRHQRLQSFFQLVVLEQPKKGHGEYRRLAQHLGVSTTLVSQIFKGNKHPSLEIVLDIGEVLGLNDLEFEYFLLQVEYAKAVGISVLSKLWTVKNSISFEK